MKKQTMINCDVELKNIYEQIKFDYKNRMETTKISNDEMMLELLLFYSQINRFEKFETMLEKYMEEEE